MPACHAPRERVSWNLVPNIFPYISPVTLHVSVWVEIQFRAHQQLSDYGHAPRERVSWNLRNQNAFWLWIRHAPRERVSWNLTALVYGNYRCVTLHVSVWVEIQGRSTYCWKNHESRSTWACELKFFMFVSPSLFFASRSTWACELKLILRYNP